MRSVCCRRFAAHERSSKTIYRLTPAATCYRRFATTEIWAKTDLKRNYKHSSQPNQRVGSVRGSVRFAQFDIDRSLRAR
jgi:hypothetical protein